MRRCLFLCFGLLIAGCGSGQVVAKPVRDTTGVAASCAAVSPAQQFAAARRVFVGVMLPGPATQGGVLGSPARMRVARYLKGHGPRTVRVDTALRIEPGGITGGSEGILPRAGERWKIYTDSRRQPFATSICGGSKRLVSPPRGASAALALWRAFPVSANPRPIVPLGEGLVIDPSTGFPDEAAKIAYEEGRFALHARLPGSVGSFGRFTEISATAAYHRLRAIAVHERDKVPPLIVTGVDIGTATFETDRGRMRLPAWRFFFKGVANPASVLALGRPDLFVPPPPHRFGPPGPGNSIEASAKVSPSGKTITLSFVGGPAGHAPCDDSYRVSAVADRRAVAFTITTIAVPVPPGEACPAIGLIRTAVVHLRRPLGARVLVSASDGGAVPVTTG
ncbi:MAG TPA: hypothetical protein VJU80_03605 [Solirubrobacteraceae bacterium]|nr:hypothetical protein [Solirubrobacteraceae bacterium]